MASEHSQLPGYSTTPEPSLVIAEGQLEKHPLRGILRFGPYSQEKQRITTLAILASNRPFAFRLKAEEQISLSHCQAT